MISLGCAKNLVDAEIMLGSLMEAGVEITNDPADADAIIVNTCSFIDAAQEESVDTILESAEVREADNRGQALIVSGCLPQRFREALPELMPEVDAFMGIDQVTQVGEIVSQAMHRRKERLARKPAAKSARSRKAQIVERFGQLDAGSKDRASDGAEAIPHALAGLNGPKEGSPQALGKPGHLVGLAEHPPLVEIHARPKYIPDYATPRFRLTPKHSAYVKIAEGCNHPCSFCIIPRMRGSHRSRALADVVEEARQLVHAGVKELNLISQDTTYYGLDLRPQARSSIASPARFAAAMEELPTDATTLSALLRELNSIPGDFWIRLLYTHPAHWTDQLIQTIAECRKVARYVDMPLQHIHGAMLERMRRETSREYIVELISRIRMAMPGITLRTTFIVGFPGETEAYFESLLQFIRDARFERMGVFTYSQEEGTRAGNMANQVPDEGPTASSRPSDEGTTAGRSGYLHVFRRAHAQGACGKRGLSHRTAQCEGYLLGAWSDSRPRRSSISTARPIFGRPQRGRRPRY